MRTSSLGAITAPTAAPRAAAAPTQYRTFTLASDATLRTVDNGRKLRTGPWWP